MKAKNCSIVQTRPRYPNEGDPRYFQQKVLDAVTSVISTIGVITILWYLLLL